MRSLELLVVVAGLVCRAAAGSQICPDPKVEVTSFTTEDGTVVTNVAYVSQFTLRCSNGASEVPLFAEVDGRTLAAVHTGQHSYQVSWTEEVNKAKGGERSILVYDEEGYAGLRKASRNEGTKASVEPLVVVKLTHPGTYRGPWLNSEFMAALVAMFVWYMAYTTKSKLLSTKQP